MTDASGLLRAIWDQPHDDLPRLVYADWLDEHGDADRAAFIRMQCEYARLGKYEDEWYELGNRIEEMWKKHKKIWLESIPESVRKMPFERGFPAPLSRVITPNRFMALTPDELAAAPLWKFALKGGTAKQIAACRHQNAMRLDSLSCGDINSKHRLDGLFASNRFQHLQHLEISAFTFDDQSIGAFSQQEQHYPNLRELVIHHNKISDSGIKTFVDSHILSRLRQLEIFATRHTSLGVELIASTPSAINIAYLSVSVGLHIKSQFAEKSRTIKAICNSQYFRNVRELKLDDLDCREAVDELLNSEPSFRLRSLVIANHFDDPDLLRHFLQWPGLKTVRELHIYHPNIDRRIAQFFANSPCLGQLRKLKFWEYIPDEEDAARGILR